MRFNIDNRLHKLIRGGSTTINICHHKGVNLLIIDYYIPLKVTVARLEPSSMLKNFQLVANMQNKILVIFLNVLPLTYLSTGDIEGTNLKSVAVNKLTLTMKINQEKVALHQGSGVT